METKALDEKHQDDACSQDTSDKLSHSTVLADDADDDKLPPPDSARGWLVVLGSFLVLMIGVGSVNSFGVYMQEYQLNAFPTTSTSMISWIGCLQVASLNLFGIAAGVLVERFDPRAVIALGSVISGGALLAASACETPLGLLLTHGLLFGVGISFMLTPAISLSAQWMVRYRALATGIAVAGGSMGGMW
ncbi:hypothetical protein IWQ57_001701, partial [Coemansia nantahalensis]